VDIYSTNSVNVRTQGDLNLHADRDINMFAGRNFNVSSGVATNIGSTTALNLASEQALTVYGVASVGIRSDASLNLKGLTGGWKCTGPLALSGLPLLLNSGGGGDVKRPKLFAKTILSDTKFDYSRGWQVNPDGINSIVTRAPTHEPYPFHNTGVQV
jgi:hypothetical protein